ncbi:LuxR C-terminal-related transcriptional regulator [Paractinoplanes toevensis]|uniref:Helix-turn-helix transcriptional regulator n=1 Tax=Paractinoplanes toevensis TaxID=571911 RepID=A0A919TCY1_9ACTN|nr:LuxR C-terminal-related transcriptional regulator [Actinoplanes toevensis]GIM93714.1 helix-turn-helix transcriptional regulator [Actinoplanes toevensis]
MVDARVVQEPVLFGRSELVDSGLSVLSAEGGGLVYLGSPGAGRSSLLRAVAGQAAGWTVLAAPGLSDEVDLPYSGVQRLLDPVLADLPGGRHDGFVRVMEGRDPGDCRLQIGMSVVALLRAVVARRGPVLCLVDDADLLDFPSWQLIKLAIRRLGGIPVVLLATAVDSPAGREVASGLPARAVGPLDERAAHALIRRVAPDVADEVAIGLVELGAGNPGALVELGERLTAQQRRGFAPLPESLPPDSALGHRLRAAVAALPAPTRAMLLLAAAPPQAGLADLACAPPPPTTGRAVGGLGDLEPAERAGLVEVFEAGVRFRPPVLRTVIYQDAPIGRRRQAHLMLAGILAARGRRLPALLHRAAVAAAPDDVLARDLVEAAAGAAPAEAALALRYAAELAADPAVPLLGAARSAWAAGRPQDAVPLLRRIARTVAPAGVRARARSLVAELSLRGAPLSARDMLLDVAAELLPTDFPGALDALLLAGEACGRAGDPGRFTALAREAEARAGTASGNDLAVQQIAGLADLMSGADDAAFTHFRAVLQLAAGVDDPKLLIPAAMAGVLIGQDRRGAEIAGRAAALARAAGVHALVPAALEAAAYAQLAAGNYAAATDTALDGAAAARRAARLDLADTHVALLAVLAALVGDRPTTERRATDATARHDEARDLTDWAYALLDLVEGRPADAATRLAAIVAAPAGRGSAILRVAVIPHLVEAAGSAAPPVDAFDAWAGRTGEPSWLALRARCRALRTTDGDAADDHFREALRRHHHGFARAHTELLYGSHLRRRRRHLEARDHLRQAAETFHRLDAAPWAVQATRELRAAGDRVPAMTTSPLTAQQERIAGLVADGATNREVAQQLHLSPRTVDHHLRNVFARLGVRSRTELARLLAAG